MVVFFSYLRRIVFVSLSLLFVSPSFPRIGGWRWALMHARGSWRARILSLSLVLFRGFSLFGSESKPSGM